ncbi:hypothetical protein Tcan_00169, partial [Toxocara canis]
LGSSISGSEKHLHEETSKWDLWCLAAYARWSVQHTCPPVRRRLCRIDTHCCAVHSVYSMGIAADCFGSENCFGMEAGGGPTEGRSKSLPFPSCETVFAGCCCSVRMGVLGGGRGRCLGRNAERFRETFSGPTYVTVAHVTAADINAS